MQAEREAFEVVIRNGKFVYNQSGELLDTTGGPKDAKWIFVLSAFKILYVGQKKKGTFQHSSFLAGGATLSAGRLVVEDGVLKVGKQMILCLKIAVLSFSLCKTSDVLNDSFNLIGGLASQWTLPPNRREFPGVHVISSGTQC